jgi:hypothetical protein
MDQLSKTEKKFLELGGNKQFQTFVKQNNIQSYFQKECAAYRD